MRAKKAKVLAQGVPMGLSVNAREIISANKGRLMGPSMQSLEPQDRAQVDNKFAPIVAGARDMLRFQASLDAMQNMSASLGRNTPNITSWADSRTNTGPAGQQSVKLPSVTVQQNNNEAAVDQINAADAGSDVLNPGGTSSSNKQEQADLDGESKGVLLMVVLGAALAAVLVAFS
jgi:hypothetical protein